MSESNCPKCGEPLAEGGECRKCGASGAATGHAIDMSKERGAPGRLPFSRDLSGRPSDSFPVKAAPRMPMVSPAASASPARTPGVPAWAAGRMAPPKFVVEKGKEPAWLRKHPSSSPSRPADAPSSGKPAQSPVATPPPSPAAAVTSPYGNADSTHAAEASSASAAAPAPMASPAPAAEVKQNAPAAPAAVAPASLESEPEAKASSAPVAQASAQASAQLAASPAVESPAALSPAPQGGLPHRNPPAASVSVQTQAPAEPAVAPASASAAQAAKPADAAPAPSGNGKKKAVVEVHAVVAGVVARNISRLVDLLCLLAAVAVVLALAEVTTGRTLMSMDRVGALAPYLAGMGCALALVYFTLFHALMGRTPGKWVTGIHVLDDTGRPPSLGRSLARSLMAFVSAAPLFGGYVAALFSHRRLTLHDKVSGTYVVRLIQTKRR